jgi:hypothetical protein
MQDLIQKAADIPWAGLLPVGAVFILGLILWVAGRPVLRPVFIAVGLIAGGLAGVELGVLPQVANLAVPLWGWAAAGAVVAALVAALAYRVILVVAIGALLAAVAPLLVWAAVELQLIRIEGPRPDPIQELLAREDPGAAGPIDAAHAEPPDAGLAPPEPAADTTPAAGEDEPAPPDAAGVPDAAASGPERAPAEWRRWATTTVRYVSQTGRDAWEESSASLRWALAAAAAVGALLGLVVGASAPSFSASVVTALGGALLLIGSGCTVAARLSLPPALLPQSATAWLAWWAAAAVIGLGLQWMFRPRPADK